MFVLPLGFSVAASATSYKWIIRDYSRAQIVIGATITRRSWINPEIGEDVPC